MADEPVSRMEAVSGSWFIGKITDTGELHQGVVTVAGDYRVQIEGLRVPVESRAVHRRAAYARAHSVSVVGSIP